MAKKAAPAGASGIIEQVQDEIEEIIEEVGENPPTPTPMISKKPKFENKLDFSPIMNEISGGFEKINSNLEKLINSKSKNESPLPKVDDPPTTKPEPRKYKLFDEFDPSIPEEKAA